MVLYLKPCLLFLRRKSLCASKSRQLGVNVNRPSPCAKADHLRVSITSESHICSNILPYSDSTGKQQATFLSLSRPISQIFSSSLFNSVAPRDLLVAVRLFHNEVLHGRVEPVQWPPQFLQRVQDLLITSMLATCIPSACCFPFWKRESEGGCCARPDILLF